MNGNDITLTIVIIVIFIFLFIAPLLSVGIQKIKNNWVEYRCNPIVIPFAGFFGHDPSETFTFCIQTMTKDFMGYLLLPTHYSTTLLQNIGGNLESSVNDGRKMISSIRNAVTDITQTIFGAFINILIETQKFTINLKDIISKQIAVFTTLLFMINGSMQAMQSAWNGPPGKLLKPLCFKSNTKIQLFAGEVREMKHLNLGDKLKDGSIIEGVLKLKNTSDECFYLLDKGVNDNDIFVTGCHMIENDDGKFIHVKKHSQSVKTNLRDDFVYCLMTSTNRIVIGERTFWDWNDDKIENE
tara:strand:+ start:1235 stop:2128 length:894 start_codon:yes stop_codon:yes gene_type:complete